MKSSNKIAIVIQSEVQYYSIKPLIERMRKKEYLFDIIVNTLKTDNTGFKEISSSTYKLLIDAGYKVKTTEEAECFYKIILTPYSDIFQADYKYLIRYQYSPISAKPNPVYLPDSQKKFHAILCQSTYETDILSVYAKTYFVSNLKFINYRNKTNKSLKKTVLYLPTYGDVSSIDQLQGALEIVKSKYRLVVKIHHGTNHLYEEEYRKKVLQELADDYFEADTPLADLLATADVVLSDNSGSIFEALYSKTPVAIYAKDLNERRVEGLDTLQYKLVKEGVVPHTDSHGRILDTIDRALSRSVIRKQRIKRKALFPTIRRPLDSWLGVIDMYAGDKINQDYVDLHNVYTGKNSHVQECINRRQA